MFALDAGRASPRSAGIQGAKYPRDHWQDDVIGKLGVGKASAPTCLGRDYLGNGYKVILAFQEHGVLLSMFRNFRLYQVFCVLKLHLANPSKSHNASRSGILMPPICQGLASCLMGKARSI